MVKIGLPHKQRVNKLQSQLARKSAIFLSSPSSIRYYTGFVSLVPSERDALLCITSSRAFLIHSTFSPLPNDISWIRMLTGTSSVSLQKHLVAILAEQPIQTMFIDTENLTVSEFQVLQSQGIDTQSLIGTELQDFVTTQRLLKDAAEINRMQHAAQITAQAVSQVQSLLTVGMTEIEVKRLLEHTMENAGAEGMAFPSIVAFGTNSALPHHQPSAAVLSDNMVVLIDVGAQVDGYCADMTRTIWFGSSPSKKFIEIETVVINAYVASLKIAKNFVETGEPTQLRSIDQAARSLITDAGYGELFTHTTGHGLGLDIHEHPSINWKSEVALQSNMMFTIEPGIYIDGVFGVRYENTILISDNSINELTIHQD